jgi:heme o synthase
LEKWESMRVDPAIIATTPAQLAWARASAFIELTKPRITFLVLFTAFVGFYCGTANPISFLLLFHTLTGTALTAGGAAAFNMYLERGLDSRMKRTALRPLAAGRLQSLSAFLFAGAISVAGFLCLFVFVNKLTGSLSAIIFAGYLFLYTPLKRKTWLCTLLGAVPGALPIVLGWTGANAALSPSAWALFAIVFLWQLPHFYSIGWMYREEYARAGLPVLSVIDYSGKRTSRQAVACIFLLEIVAATPFFLKLAGAFYLFGSIVLGLIFLAFGLHFAWLRDRLAARRLFIFSAIYLPALLLLLVFDGS